MDRVPVLVRAADPVSQFGITSQLRTRPEVRVLEPAEESEAAVILVVVDHLNDSAIDILRRLRMTSHAKVMLVVTEIDDISLSSAVENGVVGVLWRAEATADRLAAVVVSVMRGEGSLPGDLLGRLLEQVGRLQREMLDPRGLTLRGLTSREIDILRLAADGHETREIATMLAYSERTVKNVLYGLTTRLQLRNRTHAVAYALRKGLI